MEDMRRRRRGNPADHRLGRTFFGRDNDFQVTFVPSGAGKYSVHLFGEIEDPRQFSDAIEAMSEAGEDDLVVIHLSTVGGDTDATDTFISAMRRCKARVVVEATGGVHSAGTIILLNAPEFRLSENFNALIHNGSMGCYAKTSDVKAQIAFQSKYMDKLAHTTYVGFLTPEEIQGVIDGKDIWLDAEEWYNRWQSRQAYLKAKAIAEGRWDEETNSPIEDVDEFDED